jgi:Protein of unknown function (DUF2934)
MNTLEDRIRRRAYQLWEQAGRSGHPDDHWLQAERELASGSPDPRGATVEDAAPTEAVAAVEAIDSDLSRGKRKGRESAPPKPQRPAARSKTTG